MSLFRKKINISSRVVSIIGMHRSGTSCLAGSLQQKGLFLGKVHEKNDFNLKGNRENQSIAELNESILENSGGSWFEPPKKLIWSRKHEKIRNNIIAEFELAKVPFGGFKEPRSLITMPFWQKAITEINFIGTFRHPYLVSKSLEHRNSMPRDYAVKLWKKYNQKMIEIYEEKAFQLISFDLDPSEYLEQINSAASTLGLPDATSKNIFLDKSLRNNLLESPDDLISHDALALYEKLCNLSDPN